MVSLARLGILYPPTCVGFGTVACMTRYEAFLVSVASTDPCHPKASRPIVFQNNVPVDLPARTSYALRPSLPIDGRPSLLRHSIAQTSCRQYRNIKPVSHRLRFSASA